MLGEGDAERSFADSQIPNFYFFVLPAPFENILGITLPQRPSFHRGRAREGAAGMKDREKAKEGSSYTLGVKHV